MKKRILTMIGLLMIISACSNNNIKEVEEDEKVVTNQDENIREPEQIGKQVFSILKNLSSNSKQEYIDNFLSISCHTDTGKR